MGYELHITKAEHWVDAREHPIPWNAWLGLLESDPELTMSSDFYERRVEGGATERVYATLWRAHAGEATLWFQDGEIAVRNPDDATIVKILEIAAKLEAQVLGDDGEAYQLKASPPGWESRFD